MNLFGGARKPQKPKTDPSETILDLKAQISAVEKKQQLLDAKIDKLTKDAVAKAKANNKRGAMELLKLRKEVENQRKIIEGSRFTLETNVMALESQVFNVGILKTLSKAKDAMADTRGDLDADKVDDIMEAMQEEKDISNQIAEAITQNHGDVLDDDDLLEEYRLLEEAEMAKTDTVPAMAATTPPIFETHPTTSSVFQMPEVPTGPISNATQEEIDQLKELQASMMS